MAQPPTVPIMARGLVRSVPFVTPFIFIGQLAAGGTSVAEFDTLEGYAERSLYNSTLAYPGTNSAKVHAVGPNLDAAVFADAPTLLRIEYAVDRGGGYRAVAPDMAIATSTFANVSGLRITGRFIRVTLVNNNGAGVANVEFGVYVRSA